mmetsp:Transcript_117152/g.326380  ORF Transcript_117152/g.326380 Transcript_117152/m.326380 type:complete len:268 (+) Transcript_117152:137-940(+)
MPPLSGILAMHPAAFTAANCSRNQEEALLTEARSLHLPRHAGASAAYAAMTTLALHCSGAAGGPFASANEPGGVVNATGCRAGGLPKDLERIWPLPAPIVTTAALLAVAATAPFAWLLLALWAAPGLLPICGACPAAGAPPPSPGPLWPAAPPPPPLCAFGERGWPCCVLPAPPPRPLQPPRRSPPLELRRPGWETVPSSVRTFCQVGASSLLLPGRTISIRASKSPCMPARPSSGGASSQACSTWCKAPLKAQRSALTMWCTPRAA